MNAVTADRGAAVSRFVVRSLTGYTIKPSAWQTAGNAKPGTTWWVADTWNCWREVLLWSESPKWDTLLSGKRVRRITPAPTGARVTQFKHVAEYTAARLNAEQDEWDRGA